MALGVRFHKPPSEIMSWSVEDYALLMAHFQLEAGETDRETAKSRARQNIQSIPRRRR